MFLSHRLGGTAGKRPYDWGHSAVTQRPTSRYKTDLIFHRRYRLFSFLHIYTTL